MKIEQVRALVTGGSSGIGKEIARQLVARGAKAVISGRDEKKLRAAAAGTGAIAHAALAMLEMEDRGFITELSVWATNPD